MRGYSHRASMGYCIRNAPLLLALALSTCDRPPAAAVEAFSSGIMYRSLSSGRPSRTLRAVRRPSVGRMTFATRGTGNFHLLAAREDGAAPSGAPPPTNGTSSSSILELKTSPRRGDDADVDVPPELELDGEEQLHVNGASVNGASSVPSSVPSSTEEIDLAPTSSSATSTGQPLACEDVSAVQGSSLLAIDPTDVEIVPIAPPLLPSSPPPFVKMFRGSANYIANHRGTLAVYHIPGELLEWEGFRDLTDDIALTWLLGMKAVIVMGSRYQIDKRLGRDKATERHQSIRVTDAETLRVVKEEAGYVRFEMERQLARNLRLHKGQHNEKSGSLSFDGNVVSGNFYSAQPFGVIDGVDYMYTGFPRRVEIEKIRQVHDANDIVLLTPLGVSPSGEVFNVNSESLAATVAGALGASKIVYFTNRGTELRSKVTNKPVQNLRLSDARNLLEHNRVKIHKKGFASVDSVPRPTPPSDGNQTYQAEDNDMHHHAPAVTETLLKIGWAMMALEKGVKRAHIIAPTNGALLQEFYTRDGAGTLISRDLYEGIRRADVNDVSGIHDLIAPLIKAGTLVDRPKTVMERDILSYYVYTRDSLIVATGQLKRFEGGYAEIGCLVVSGEYRSQGRGDAMLGYLERLCLQSGATKVFVLSTQTMEWFVERGFREVGVEALPPSRRETYNPKRGSKIYMKHIEGDRDLDASELWWNR